MGNSSEAGSTLRNWRQQAIFVLDVTIGQEAEVADADKTGRQDMEEEAAEELDGREGEGFFEAAVAVILPAEADAVVFDFQQAMVGNSDPVGVATEILDDLGGAAERPLGVDHPAAVASGAQPTAKGLRIGEPSQIAEEGELPLLEGLQQGVPEEVAEAGAEDFNGQEEGLARFLGTAAGDPALAMGRQSSRRDDPMQMRVMGKLLAPGVEDGEESDLGAQMFGISGNRAERGRHGVEQQVVDDGLVLQGQPGNGLRQGEHDVEIGQREQLLLAGPDPAGLGQGLALGAMAVAAGNGELSITCLMVSDS